MIANTQYLQELLSFARTLVVNSGKLLLQEQAQAQVVKFKDRQDVCTTADLASERLTIDAIATRYPDHGILSEEVGVINPGAPVRWVIDPLDGTKEFIRGIPLFNSSLAVEIDGELAVAAVYRPTEQTLFSAALGLGAWRNTLELHVSDTSQLADAFIYCYLPSFRRDEQEAAQAWSQLPQVARQVYRLRSLADENTSMCWVAQGGTDGYINISNPPKWHDMAPGLLIAREAGAICTSLDNQPLSIGNCKQLIIANPQIHPLLVELLQRGDHPGTPEST